MAPRSSRRAVTLIELLITITIIAVMAGMILFALFQATEQSKTMKTRALIAKLDAIIKNKWEAYKTRRVPLAFYDQPFQDTNSDGVWDNGEPFTDTNSNGVWDSTESFTDKNGNGKWDSPTYTRAKLRLDMLHDLMRLEMPDRWNDVATAPVTPALESTANTKMPRPAVNQSYYRRWSASTPSTVNQGAECLYLIVTAAVAEDGDARDTFRAGDIGDTDKDGFPEFLDGWGNPIQFLRWAPGFQSELQIVVEGPGGTMSNGASISGSALSGAQGSYVGGVVLGATPQMTGSSVSPFNVQPNGASVGRISGYTYMPQVGVSGNPNYHPAYGQFACVVGGSQSPFGGSFSGVTGYVMAPDPFDPLQVYPTWQGSGNTASDPANQWFPDFALYPLIYSAGPDGGYGLHTDAQTAPFFDYTKNGLYPFYLRSDGMMIGSHATVGIPLTNAVKGGSESDFAWVDNIHNHLIGSR